MSKKIVIVFGLSLLTIFYSAYSMSPVRKAFIVNACLNYQRAQAKDTAHDGISLTHEYIKKKLSHTYTPKELARYIEKIPALRPFGALKVPPEDIDAYLQLVLKSIELEKEFSSTHYSFFHGTFEAKTIILRTLLERSKRAKGSKDLFLLRDPGMPNRLKGINSGYGYAIEGIKSAYAPYVQRKELFRFDWAQPVRSDLLAVNTNLLAHTESKGALENSLRFLHEAPERYYPGYESEAINACLSMYNLDHVSGRMKRFLYRPAGGLLVIMLPKHLAALSYASHPFAIPLGLPGELACGQIPPDSIKQVLEQHEEVPIATLFEQHGLVESRNWVQARLLLNPDYFEDDSHGVKMFLFLLENDENMAEIKDNFNAIRSMICSELLSNQKQ